MRRMKPPKHRYWKLTGKLVQMADEHFRRVQTIEDARQAFLKAMGTTQSLRSRNCIHGVAFKRARKIPDGWRKSSKHSEFVIVPDKRTRQGKEVAKQLARLSIPRPTDLDKEIGFGGIQVAKFHCIEFGVYEIGGNYFTQSYHELKHPDLVEFKKWEFLKFCEDAGVEVED